MNVPTLLYWLSLYLALSGALSLSALAWYRRSSWIVAGAGTWLVIALIIAALPTPPVPALAVIMLSLVAVALAVVGGGPAAAVTLRLATRGSVISGEHGGIMVDTQLADDKPREVLRGGLVIGLLERLAVAGSLVAGYPAALAVIVAVKGVGRFTELDSAEARERFIIGTFVSLIWASACGLLVLLTAG